MNISVSIMAHPSRGEETKLLYDRLHKMPFTCITPVFDELNDEWDTGVRALRLHDNSDWHVVIQDDAIIDSTFYANLESALEAMPEESLLSLYLGKVRPEGARVKHAFEKAMRKGASFLSHKTLLWGVCIAIPTKDIDLMLLHAYYYPRLRYDKRVGKYYLDNKRPVYYTTTSLADHNDSLPSLTGHGHSSSYRECHKFADNLVKFNGKIVVI